MPEAEEFPLIEKLKYEKEVIGIYLTGHPLDNYKVELERFCKHTVADLKLLQKMKNKEGGEETEIAFNNLRRSSSELSIGGLMSNVQHKTTKTGKPFGTFVLEDYFDSYEFALFGDDYIKFRNLLMEGIFIHVRGNIEEKFRQEGNWDLRITAMGLLSEMREKLTKSLTVVLNLDDLNSELLESLQQAVDQNIQKYPVKNCTLRFKIQDKEDAILMDMPSKSFKVNPSDELMEEIKALTKVAPVLA